MTIHMLVNRIYLNNLNPSKTPTGCIIFRRIIQTLFSNFDQLYRCHIRSVTHGVQSGFEKWTSRSLDQFISWLLCPIFVHALYLKLIESVLTRDDVRGIQVVFVALLDFAHQLGSLGHAIVISGWQLDGWLLVCSVPIDNLGVSCVTCVKTLNVVC